MGSSTSEILRQPLMSPSLPVTAINTCFCRPEPLTLHLRERPATFSKEEFVIREVASGLTLFRVDTTALSLRDRKVLQDANGQTIVHMRDHLVSIRPTVQISADYEAQHPLFRIKAHVTLFDTELDCHFHDVVNGVECSVGVVGNWRTRAAMVWIDQGDGRKIPIARAYRPPPVERTVILDKQEYYVDIAPHVDIALIVLICLALDEAKKVPPTGVGIVKRTSIDLM